MWPLYKRRLQRSKLPVIAGPWKGELGFEQLYWLPFVRRLGIPKERLIALTRGGAAQLWYPADRAVEIYDLRTPKQIRVDNTLTQMRTGMLKQTAWTAMDRELVKEAAARLGLKDYLVLHPKWMYACLTPFWEGRMAYTDLERHVKIESLPPVEATGGQMPETFVAVRFYARATFPLSEATQTVVVETVKHIARSYPVVLLNSGIHADDHFDFDIPKLDNVFRMADLYKVTPQNNFAVQSALLSKCQGFVGTYGGLAQLALMYKKPTISLYQDWQGTAVAHKQLMQAVALQMGVPCQVLRVTEIPLLYATLPKIEISFGGSSGVARELRGQETAQA